MAIDDLLKMEASGWKGAAGTAMALHPEREAFLRDASARLAARSRLHLLTLEAAGTPAAMCLGVVCGSGLYLLHLDFDEQFARFSPGAQLEALVTEFFSSSTRADVMDPCCAPSNAFHAHFLPDRLEVFSALIAIGGPLDRALVHTLVRLAPARRLAALVKSRVHRASKPA